LATLATTRKAMGGRNKPTYVVIGRSGLSIYPIYIFSLWAGPPSADRGLGLQWTSPSAADNVIQRRRCRCRRYRRLVFPTGAIHPTTARHRSHPAADRPPPGNDHLLDGNNGSGHHSATAPGVSSVRHSAHTNSRSAGRPAVSRRDASPTAPTPEGEANPHGETYPPICPARRDTSGLGIVTDPRTPPDSTRFVRPPTDRRAPLRYAVTDPQTPQTLPGVRHSTPGTYPFSFRQGSTVSMTSVLFPSRCRKLARSQLP
jgi:hypothetical protein